MRNKIIIIDYPTEMTFITRKDFKDNTDRTNHLRSVLRKKQIESPNHDYNDYVVEFHQVLEGSSEYWIVGS
jgi:hypothetical protein